MRVRSSRAWWAALAALPVIAVAATQATPTAAADEETEGRVVEISPNRDAEDGHADQRAEARRSLPKYWIGLQGRQIASPVLRTQLQLADDVGVVIENVVPDSPAAKAGLRQHDVLVAVGGEPISDLRALQQAVADGGAKPIELKVIRLAKETTIEVTPEETPEDAFQGLAPQSGQNPLGMGAPLGDIEQLFRQLQQGGAPRGMRMIGPGMVFQGQPFQAADVPEGVSVSITRAGDGPATITVEKDGQSWTVQGNDQEALEKLPDDVRPLVEQMLAGPQPGRAAALNFDFGELRELLPDGLGQFDAEPGLDNEALRRRAESARERTERASERLMERLEQMEERLQRLQRQMDETPAEEGVESDSST